MSPAPSPSPGSVFSIPAFRRLWMAQFVSVFGDFLAFYAASSFISFRLHGSPRQVTMIMVAFLTPFALVGPIAGVFVDRWDARRTMVMSDVIRAALVLGLLWAGAPWQIYSTFAALSVVSTFFIPAQSVTTPARCAEREPARGIRRHAADHTGRTHTESRGRRCPGRVAG